MKDTCLGRPYFRRFRFLERYAVDPVRILSFLEYPFPVGSTWITCEKYAPVPVLRGQRVSGICSSGDGILA